MKVFIVGSDISIERLWQSRKHQIVDSIDKADVVQFIGGADIGPELYGETPHNKTCTDAYSDKRDMEAWRQCKPHQLRAGICRGSQFLNVMNGGALWQHIDGHRGWKGHHIKDLISNREFLVTSTHHQMMIPAEGAELLGFARAIAHNHGTNKPEGRNVPKVDAEVIWYYGTKSLCFQPHPEINGFDDCRNYYFSLIDKLYEPKK